MDAECRALVQSAFHFDRSAHDIDDLLDNRQPQTGSALGGSIHAVLLGERFEQTALELFAHG